MATLFDANKLIRKQERENKSPKSWTFKPQETDDGGILDTVLDVAKIPVGAAVSSLGKGFNAAETIKNTVEELATGTPSTSKSTLGRLGDYLEETAEGISSAGKNAMDNFQRGLMIVPTETSKGLDVISGFLAEKFGTEKKGFFGTVNRNLQKYADTLEDPNDPQRYAGQGFERVLNPEWWTDKYGIGTDVPYSVGNMLSFLGTMKLPPVNKLGTIGGYLAEKGVENVARKAAQKGFKKTAEKLSSNFAKNFARNGAEFATVGAPLGAFVNASTTIDALREQGLSDSEISAKMFQMMGEELPADVLFSMLTGGVMGGTVGRGVAGSLPKGITSPMVRNLLGAGTAFGLEMGGNKFSNEYQMRLANKYSGNEYGDFFNPTDSERDAGFLGMLGGIVPSAIGARNQYRALNAERLAAKATEDLKRANDKQIANNLNRQSASATDRLNQRTADLQAEIDNLAMRLLLQNAQAQNRLQQAQNKTQTATPSQTATPVTENESAIADDPNLTATENKMWQLAQRAAKRAKEKYNLNLKPELIYRQWWHETAYQGKSFNSRLLREVNNLGGLKTRGEATNSPAPDGGYYREFNSLEDSADAYVDNYIKHRPELNNVATIEDWANVMRDTNYYMETDNMTRQQAVNAYIAGMKGAKVPNTQGYSESGTKTRQNTLSYDAVYNAFKPYDGKTMDNHTVGCVEAATKIGSGFSSFLAEELKKGTVNVDVLRDNAEKAGLLSRDVSNIQAGDVLGWDTNGHHHVVIADGKGGFFGNSSSMDKVYHSDRAHSFGTPDWIIKTGGNTVSTTTAETSTTETSESVETAEPTETSTTPQITNEESELEKFYRDFVQDRKNAEDTTEFKNFLGKMENEEGEFQNTPENRNAVFEKYQDELASYIADRDLPKYFKEKPAPIRQAKTSAPETPKIKANTKNLDAEKSKYLNNADLRSAVENLREKAVQNGDIKKVADIQSALESNNTAAMKKFVKDAGIKIETRVKGKEIRNTAEVDEIEKLPYEQITDSRQLDAMKIAARPMSKVTAERQSQGRALKFILEQNGIKANKNLVGALDRGLQGAVKTVQGVLRSQGFLPPRGNIKSLQEKLASLKKSQGTEIKNLEKAFDNNDDAAIQAARDKIKDLKQQIDNQTAEIENFRKDPQHLENLQNEFEILTARRDSLAEILNDVGEDKALLKRQNALDKKISALKTEIEGLKGEQAKTPAQSQTADDLQNEVDLKTRELDLKTQLADELQTLYDANITGDTLQAETSNEKIKSLKQQINQLKQAQPAPKKSKSKNNSAQQQLLQQVNEAAHKLNLETIAKADAAKNKTQSAPTSKKSYHFDGTENIESEEMQNESESKNQNDFTETENSADKNQNAESRQGKTQDEVKEKRVAKNFKAKADKVLNDFADGKTDAATTYDKLETLQKVTEKNKILNASDKADVNDYIEKLKNDIVDYLHGEKNIEVKSAQENDSAETNRKSVYNDQKSAENGKKQQSDEENLQQNNSAETKKALNDLAEKSWNDKNYNGKVSFTPSQKFRDKAQELFGHDVNEVFITADDVRHIKNKHGESEEKRGQIDIKPENISEIYDVVNDFDSATKERDDKQGNQNIMVVRSNDGKNFALLVERGKSKAQVKTFYKQKETSQVSDAKSPNLNAQSDPVKVSAETISQKQDSDKEISQQSKPAETSQTAKKIGKRIEGFNGDDVKIRLKTGAYTEGVYRIVEADDLLTSHNADGTRVDKYPTEFQPRDRASQSMISQMQKIARQTDANILLDMTQNPNEGAPVVRSDGVVLNGNGRIAGIKEGYRLAEDGDNAGKAIENYRDELINRAKRFGISAAEIEDMASPVLVREVTDNISAEELSQLTEAKEGGATLSPEEQARTDAKKIKREMFYKYTAGLKEDLKAAQNEEFVQDVLRAISTENEYSQYFNSEGLTDTGEQRVQQVLLRYAFNSDKLVTNASALDTEGRNLQNALEKSAATFAKAKMDMISHAELEQYNLEDIKDAAEKYLELKRQGTKISDYLNEVKLESGGELKQDSAEMRELLKNFDKYTRSGQKLNNFVKNIADQIAEINDLNGQDLFGAENPTFLEIIKNSATNVDNSGNVGLFSASGKVDTTIKNKIAQKDLNSQQKKFVGWGKSIGMPVQFFKGDKNFYGYFGTDGVSYLNADSAKNLAKTFWHETTHWLGKHNPKFLKSIIDAGNFTDRQRTIKRNSAEVYKNLPDAKLDEEILADNMKDLLTRGETLQEISNKNPSLAEKFISYVKQMLDKFTSYFTGNLTRQQKDNIYNAFAKNVRAIKDAKGNKKFRVNNLTHEVQHIDGTAIEKFNLQLFADLVDNASKNTDNTRKINDYLSIRSDGHFDVKLLHEKPSVGEETERERIERRKKEVANMDKLLGVRVNPDAYAQLLTDRTLAAIDKKFDKVGEWNEIEREYKLAYNSVLAKYSETTPEEKVIGVLFNLKGAIRYAERQGSIAGRNRFADDRRRGQIVRDVEQADARETGTGNRINARHSERQGAFSISDNSSESLPQKIKNALGNWWTTKPLSNRRNKRITQKLQRLTNYKIRYEHFLGDNPILIDTVTKVIKSEKSYDWENLLPACGEIVAQDLNLTPSEEMKGYIADWLLTGATQNNSPQAKEFERAMRDNPDKAEFLQAVRQEFEDFNNLEAIEQVQETIVHNDGREKNSPQEIFDKFYTETVDDTHPLERMVQEIEKRSGLKLDAVMNPHEGALLAKGSDGIAELLIRGENEEEIQRSNAVLAKIFPGVNFDNFKPFQAILNKAGGVKKFRQFEAFSVAMLDMEIREKNEQEKVRAEAKRRKLQAKIDDLEDKISQATSKRESKKLQKQRDKLQEEMEGIRADHYQPKYTEKQCREIIDKYQDEFGEAHKELVEYSRTIAAIMKDSGLITQRQFTDWTKNWQNYIPSHRIFDEMEDFEFADSTKEKKGSTKDILSPLQVMLNNTTTFIRSAEINKLKGKIAMLARMGAYGDLISEEDFKQGKEPAITYKFQGKTKYLATTESIKQAIDSLNGNYEASNFVFKMINAATSMTRAFLTSDSPDFAAGNIFKDSQEAYLYNKKGSLNPYRFIKNIISGTWRVLTGAAHHIGLTKRGGLKTHTRYYEWKGMGGSQATMVSADINRAEILINDLTKTNFEKWFGTSDQNAVKRIQGFFGQVLKSFQEFSETLENSTRLAVYENTIEHLAKQNGGQESLSDKKTAALESRQATIDFARSGNTTRKINRKIAFFNATIQGLDKTARALNPQQLLTTEGRKNLLDTIFRLMIGTVSMAALQVAMTAGKDWYDEIPEWQKNNNWILGENFKIPKSYDLLSRLTGVIAEDIFGNAPVENHRYLKTLFEALPSIIPTIAQPAAEAWADYSFFYDNSIVPKKEQDLEKSMQYGDKTSEFAKVIGGSSVAKVIGEIFRGDEEGFSPRKIDHMIKSYFGFPGSLLTGAGNYVKKNVSDGQEYSFEASEFPVLKRFIFDPYKNPQTITDYYDKRNELNRKYVRPKIKPVGEDAKLLARIKAAEKQMTKISKQETKLKNDAKISAKELKQKLRELEFKRLEIAKRALGR